MKITNQWLINNKACPEGRKWFLNQPQVKLDAILMKLLEEGHCDWANWVIVRFMSNTQKVVYAAFAAKQVLSLFEEKYPRDKSARKAIAAAIRFVGHPIYKNREYFDAAYAAANAADDAAYAASYAPYAAASAASYTAYAAAYAADDVASYTTYAAEDAAHAAAYAATHAGVAKVVMFRKILTYGMKLLTKKGV